MFEYKIESDKYWITSNKIKWEFWPFIWVFVKNKYIWNIVEWVIDEKKYPWYKYSVWVWNNNFFIIWKQGIVDVLKLTK